MDADKFLAQYKVTTANVIREFVYSDQSLRFDLSIRELLIWLERSNAKTNQASEGEDGEATG